MAKDVTAAATDRRARRYRFVTATQQLILEALPFHRPASPTALTRFLDAASTARLPDAEADAILLKVLGLDPLWWTLSERRIRCPRWPALRSDVPDASCLKS